MLHARLFGSIGIRTVSLARLKKRSHIKMNPRSKKTCINLLLAALVVACSIQVEAFSLTSSADFHSNNPKESSTSLSSSAATSIPLGGVSGTGVGSLYNPVTTSTPPAPVQVQPSTAPAKSPKATSRAHAITILESTEELAEFMNGVGGDELTVVKYHAHYCKICQRAGIQLKKVASEFPNVRFGKVESMVFPDSANTLRGLGVTKFPFLQIYRRGQCVASFSTGPSHMFAKRVRDTLTDCEQRTPAEWDAFVSEFSNEISSNQEARSILSQQS